jgi:uncharacterized membrane protein
MNPRERPTSPSERPPPPGRPLEPWPLSQGLVRAEPDVGPEPVAGEPAAKSAACPFCGGEVTSRDERCPRCAARVVPPGTRPMEKIRYDVSCVYVMQGLALFCGLPAIPGLLMSYGNRRDARETWLDSHCEWQIDTFWGFFWFWLCGLAVLFVGDHFLGKGLLGHGPALLVIFAGVTWYIARVVKGYTRLVDGDPVTDY